MDGLALFIFVEIDCLDEEAAPARLGAFTAAGALAENLVAHEAAPRLRHTLRTVNKALKLNFSLKTLMDSPHFLKRALARED
jgi:hypothetical protein